MFHNTTVNVEPLSPPMFWENRPTAKKQLFLCCCFAFAFSLSSYICWFSGTPLGQYLIVLGTIVGWFCCRFGREQSRPHNVLGYTQKEFLEHSVLERKGKPHNVPGYVPDNISRTFVFMNKGRQRQENRKGKERNKRKPKELNRKESSNNHSFCFSFWHRF